MARAGADVGVGPAAAMAATAQRRRGHEHALGRAVDDFGDRPRGVEPVAVEAAVEFAPVVAVDSEPVADNRVGGAADAPRSEDRRGGKEGGDRGSSRWSAYHKTKKNINL